MFETAQLGRTISRADYRKQEPLLRAELLGVQQELLRAVRFPVIVVFSGADGAGKGETVNLLNEWMDPRWIVTRAFSAMSDEERERPEYWRFWRSLPPKGVIGLFLSCWYSRPLLDRVYGRTTASELDECLDKIVAFEKALADDGALILKFWMHLGREHQKARLKKLERDPLTRWRVTETDWKHWRMYDGFIAANERIIMRTSTGEVPWKIVEGSDARYRSITVGVAVRDAIRKRLALMRVEERVREELMQKRREQLAALAEDQQDATVEAMSDEDDNTPADPAAAQDPGEVSREHTILSTLDMFLSLGKQDYKTQLEQAQGRLNELYRKARARQVSTILVLEGWDAAGKGGAIRRVIAALDARDYQVIPISKPTDEEQAQHYLWRFWRYLPRAGRFTVFDRSWYGRALVERVEHFATEAEWMRAYAEINQFEQELVQHGIVLVKFWVHITKDEQMRRFKAREQIAYKSWKLTEEDWRNRANWDLYEQAVNDMVERTSTGIAPWTLVEGNDKRYARIKVINTVCERLQAALDRHEGLQPAAST